MNNLLVPVNESHAEILYPLITKNVTTTIQWDGPSSLSEYQTGLKVREQAHVNKEIYLFTIIHPKLKRPIGSIDIRPDQAMFRANIGLWIGEEFHGQGIGTKSIEAITYFGFHRLNLKKIEGYIFEGNVPSRKIFEKCGYRLEGTIRSCTQKKGKAIDEWVLGITHDDFYRD